MRGRVDDRKCDGKPPLEHWVTWEDLQRFKEELLSDINSLLEKNSSDAPRKWLKSYEVRKLLNVSAGTLQTLRVNGTLPYTKMGGALYYEYADILKILNKSKVEKKC